MEEVEIWADHPDYNNYSFSTFGNVKNKTTLRIINGTINKSGYNRITLINNEGKNKPILKHRIIAEVFIPNPDNKPTVNHINKKRSYNRVSNLEWATHVEQIEHQRSFEPIIQNNNKGVWKCDIKTKDKIKFYNTLKEAAISVGITVDNGFKNISNCARGITQSCYGFYWQFDNFESLPDEEWALIKNEYYVSTLGRLRHKERLLKTSQHHGGYVYGGGFSEALHILVARAFIPNPNNEPNVYHINGVHDHNHLDNLIWSNPVDYTKNQVKFRKNVISIVHYEGDEIIDIYESTKDVERKLNISATSVNKCCKGTILTAGKLHFKYLADTDDIDNGIIDVNTIPKKIYKDTVEPPNQFKIEVLNKKYESLGLYNTKTEVSKIYGANIKTIDSHCKGINKSYNINYIFRYSNILIDNKK